jgi:hypothetical protein
MRFHPMALISLSNKGLVLMSMAEELGENEVKR